MKVTNLSCKGRGNASAARALAENWLSSASETTGLPWWGRGKEPAASARDALAKEYGERHTVHGFTKESEAME